MGRLIRPDHAAAAQSSDALAEFYGDPVPASAVLLENYVRAGHIPLRDPDGNTDEAVTIDLWQTASALGGDLTDSRRHLHRLHATGQLTIDQHGTVHLTEPAHGSK